MTFLLKPRFHWLDALVIFVLLAITPYTPWFIELAYLVVASITTVHLERRYDHRP